VSGQLHPWGKSPLYTLSIRLSEPAQNRSGQFGGEKNLYLLAGIETLTLNDPSRCEVRYPGSSRDRGRGGVVYSNSHTPEN